MTTTRTTGGRFAPGASGNTRGRPSNARRAMGLVEQELLALGATREDVDRLAHAAGNPMRAALAIAVMAAALAEQREHQNTPAPALTHAGDSPAR